MIKWKIWKKYTKTNQIYMICVVSQGKHPEKLQNLLGRRTSNHSRIEANKGNTTELSPSPVYLIRSLATNFVIMTGNDLSRFLADGTLHSWELFKHMLIFWRRVVSNST